MIEHLTQTERLALCPVSPFVTIRDEECEVTPLSSPPNGFKMPSIQAVREHDARLSLQSRPSFTMDDESEDESEDEALASETAYKRRDAMREHSFRLPSQSSRRECLAEMRALGLGWNE
jgi:hypothetical protein